MKKILSLILTVVLVFSVSIFAFAAGPTGNTVVQFQLSDTQVSASFPLQIVGTVNADGSLTFPTTAKIVNESVFAIRVSSILCSAETGWTLAETEGTENDTIVATVKGNGGTIGVPLVTTTQTPGADFNMAAAGAGATSEVALTFSGNVYKLTKPLTTTPTNVFTITFTVASGSNT